MESPIPASTPVRAEVVAARPWPPRTTFFWTCIGCTHGTRIEVTVNITSAEQQRAMSDAARPSCPFGCAPAAMVREGWAWVDQRDEAELAIMPMNPDLPGPETAVAEFAERIRNLEARV